MEIKGLFPKLFLKLICLILSNGQAIEIILNPLGVPSRMNMGQLFETHLALLQRAGIYVKSPVFEGSQKRKFGK